MTETTRDKAPDEVRALAQARAAARDARDWPEADRLRAEIEAAGWRVVDRGTRFQLLPAAPPDVVEDGRVRHGSSRSVPSRLDQPATDDATVIVVVADRLDGVERLVDGLHRTAPPRTQVVIVADAPSHEAMRGLEADLQTTAGQASGTAPEILWTATRLGPAGALNAGIRRATGSVVVVLDPSVEVSADVLTPIVRVLDDPTIAVAGLWGSVSTDVRRWTAAPAGDVDTIDLTAMAFRRDDYIARGPLDERFQTPEHLARWWSLVLRDDGEDAPPRRAVRLAETPIVRHETSEDPRAATDPAGRDAKRDFYRVIDRFGRRRDLLVAGQPARGLSGT